MDNFVLNIERTLLSTILYDNKNLEIFVKYGLKASDFNFLVHKEIYKAMFSLSKKLLEINLINLHSINQNFEQHLVQIELANPVTNPIHYIETLKDYKLKQEIITNSKKLIALEKDDEVSGKRAFSLLLENINQINLENQKLFKIYPLDDAIADKPKILCSNIVPIVKKTVNLFTAKGGTGKTFLLLTIALHYQLNEIKNKTFNKCFCWFTEDDSSIIKNRKAEIIKDNFSQNDAKLLLDPQYKDLLQISNELPFHFLFKNNKNKFEVEEQFYILKYALKDFELLIFDPLASFLGINENDNSLAKSFMNLMVHWAREEDKAIALIHHTPYKEEKARGSESIRDTSKIHYFIRKIYDKEGKILPNTKDSLEIIIDKDNYNILKNFNKKFRVKVFPKDN